MSPRWSCALLPLVALLAAPACGNDDAEQGPPESLRIELNGPDRVVSGEPVTWDVAVVNDTPEPVQLTCPTAQQGDIVLTRDGTTVYRWSDGRVFAQVITEVEIAPGSHPVLLEDDELDVPPGAYELRASVTCQPSPEPLTQRIVVD